MIRSLEPETPSKSSLRAAEQHSRSRDKNLRQRTCRVPVCLEPYCMLRSHQQFGRGVRTRENLNIERPIRTEAQILGLETAQERDLFQHCLVNMIRRKVFTYSPACLAVPSLSKMRESLVTSAMESRSSAVIIVSLAFCDVFLKRAIPSQDLERCYMKTQDVVRNGTDPDLVLMGLVAQSILDQYRGRDLMPYRRSIKDIAQGRVHTLRDSLHYVVEADRRLALWTNTVADLAVSEMSVVDEITYIEASRNLVGLFEKEGRSIDSSDIVPISPYLYYRRDQLADAFTYLQATANPKGWCMIAAARIMEYGITFEGELESCMMMVLSTLTQRLKSRIREVDWSSDQQMLIWILFVIEDVWTIRRLLEDHNHGKLPTCEQQWHILREHFVWPERNKPHFERLFEAVTKCIVRSDKIDCG